MSLVTDYITIVAKVPGYEDPLDPDRGILICPFFDDHGDPDWGTNIPESKLHHVEQTAYNDIYEVWFRLPWEVLAAYVRYPGGEKLFARAYNPALAIYWDWSKTHSNGNTDG